MTGLQLPLKHPMGWFAAGREVARALTLLSDSAFKLFMWICLSADRGLGVLQVEPQAVARVLGKTEAEIMENLRDLLQAEICQQTADGAILIMDRFWPYERLPVAPRDENLAVYISETKRVFLQRRCVCSAFTAAKLTTQLYRDGVSIVVVARAILVGSLRKYITLINHGGRGTPITSLRYFNALFKEVTQEISPGYWAYIERRLREVE
jgi:hypothetical protein